MDTRRLIVIALTTPFMVVGAAKAEDPVYFADANLKAAVVEEFPKTEVSLFHL